VCRRGHRDILMECCPPSKMKWQRDIWRSGRNVPSEPLKWVGYLLRGRHVLKSSRIWPSSPARQKSNRERINRELGVTSVPWSDSLDQNVQGLAKMRKETDLWYIGVPVRNSEEVSAEHCISKYRETSLEWKLDIAPSRLKCKLFKSARDKRGIGPRFSCKWSSYLIFSVGNMDCIWRQW
jgi:hypothetical protein